MVKEKAEQRGDKQKGTGWGKPLVTALLHRHSLKHIERAVGNKVQSTKIRRKGTRSRKEDGGVFEENGFRNTFQGRKAQENLPISRDIPGT